MAQMHQRQIALPHPLIIPRILKRHSDGTIPSQRSLQKVVHILIVNLYAGRVPQPLIQRLLFPHALIVPEH